MEKYINIENHNGYQVSNLGNIKSLKKGKECIKKSKVTRNGYLRIRLCQKSIKKYYSVHRFVALAFIPNPENKRCVNHKDGNKLNNNLNNLEWCTHSENSLHSFKNGLQKSKKGNESKNSKISEKQALEIKENKDNLYQKELSKIYGISQSQISRIITKKQRN